MPGSEMRQPNASSTSGADPRSERGRQNAEWVDNQLNREFLKHTRWVGPLDLVPLLLILAFDSNSVLNYNYIKYTFAAIVTLSIIRTLVTFLGARMTQNRNQRSLIHVVSTLGFATASAWGNLGAGFVITLGLGNPQTTLVLVCCAAIAATAATTMSGNLIALLLFEAGLTISAALPLMLQDTQNFRYLPLLGVAYGGIMVYQSLFQHRVLRQSLINRFLAMEEVNRSQVFMNTVPGLVAIFGSDSKMISVNHHLQSHIVGKSWHNVAVGDVFPNSTLAATVQAFLWSDRDSVCSEVQLGPEFGNRWNLITLRRLNFPLNGAIFLAIDIDESKRNREDLDLARIKNQAAGRLASLGEMAGGIAHEINNPLTVIIGRAQQIQNWVDEGKMDGAKIKSFAESIRQTGVRIGVIIKGLRAFARDSEKDPYVRAKVKDIVDETLSFCQARIQGHGIELRRPKTIDETWTVDCRPVQMGQILLNLMNNAHDAVEHLEEKWVQIELEIDENSLKLMVTDSGTGIPPEIAEKIMEPFFTTKDTNRGTGLGLSIAKGLVDAHKGRLVVDSSCPNTRFVVTIPRYRSDVQPNIQAAA